MASLELVQEHANPLDLLRGSLLARERPQDQTGGRSTKGPVQEIAHEPLFGLVLGQAGAVDMGALRLIPSDQALLRHDLEELQDRGVPDAPRLELLVDLAHGRGPPSPEDVQDLELGVGRPGGLFRHDVSIYEESSTKFFVYQEDTDRERHRARRSGAMGLRSNNIRKLASLS